MKGQRILFSSEKIHWATPKTIYDHFIKKKKYFDPCPLRHNIKKWDGLKIRWKKYNFVNPPYDRKLLPLWIEKGIEEYKKGKNIVFLIASRTDTIYFYNLMKHNPKLVFIKGRLKFGGCSDAAPFPSVLIYLFHRKRNIKIYDYTTEKEIGGYNG